MPKIDEESCHELRDRQGDDTQIELAKEYGVSQQTVNYHQNGYCSHSEEPTNKTVEEKDCFDIQAEHHNGHKIVEIADRHGVSSPTVLYHLDGNCSHPRVEPDGVTTEDCNRFRELAGVDPLRQIARESPYELSTIQYHVRGECGHETETPPLDTDLRNHVDEDECQQIRSLFEEGMNRVEIGEATNRDRSTVRFHLHGECGHSEEGMASPDRDEHKVDQPTCSKMRAEYVSSPDVTVIADDHDLGPNTVRNHISGNCRHAGEGVPITRNELHPLMWDAVYWLYFENHAEPAHIAESMGVSEDAVKTVVGKITETGPEDIPEEIPSD